MNGDDARRMSTAIAGGLVLAIMTGPDGAITDPTYGVKTSLLSGHVVGYLIFGVIIGCLLTYRAKVKDGTWRRDRTTPRRTLLERATSLSSVSRYAFLAVTAFAVAIITLIFADFSGPVARNKLSMHRAPVFVYANLRVSHTGFCAVVHGRESSDATDNVSAPFYSAPPFRPWRNRYDSSLFTYVRPLFAGSIFVASAQSRCRKLLVSSLDNLSLVDLWPRGQPFLDVQARPSERYSTIAAIARSRNAFDEVVDLRGRWVCGV
jgi:hypothetical protein